MSRDEDLPRRQEVGQGGIEFDTSVGLLLDERVRTFEVLGSVWVQLGLFIGYWRVSWER